MLDIQDFMQTVDGQGVINILAADKLMNAPRLYATFLLWMLSELFEQLPEIGDPEAQSWSSSSTKPTCCSTRRPGAGRAHRAGGAPGALKGVGCIS